MLGPFDNLLRLQSLDEGECGKISAGLRPPHSIFTEADFGDRNSADVQLSEFGIIQQMSDSQTISSGCRNLITCRQHSERQEIARGLPSPLLQHGRESVSNSPLDLKTTQHVSNRVGRRDVLSGSSLLAASVLMGGPFVPATSEPANAQAAAATSSAVPADLIGDIATSAYIYAYPLIFMEMTRRIGTNVANIRTFARAPMNQFANVPAFPDATFTDVTRPNVDTLYSLMWFDVSQEPLLISVPDSGGRFYLLQMCDMWTDVFDSPGKRTTGTSAQVLAIAGPGWQGQLPAEATLIHSPTAIGWIIGRTQTNGKADYDAVHKFQAGLIATPLSQWGKPYQPPAGSINPDWDMATPPIAQVEKLSPAAYFSLFAELTALNPPHANDYPILHQMRRIGIEPGKPFAFDRVSPEIRRALTEAGPAALNTIKARLAKAGVAKTGWRTNLTAIGTYGADYLNRAGIAYAGIGANTIEDAVYPTAFTDAEGKPFSSDSRYVLIPTRTRYRRYAPSGRSRCTTKSSSSRPIRSTALPLAIATSSHSIPTARSISTFNASRPAGTKSRIGCQPRRVVLSR